MNQDIGSVSISVEDRKYPCYKFMNKVELKFAQKRIYECADVILTQKNHSGSIYPCIVSPLHGNLHAEKLNQNS